LQPDALVNAGFLKRREHVAAPAIDMDIVKTWPKRRAG